MERTFLIFMFYSIVLWLPKCEKYDKKKGGVGEENERLNLKVRYGL